MTSLVSHVTSTARLLLADPPAAVRRLRRIAGLARAAVVLRDCSCGELVYLGGDLDLLALGTVRFADRVQISTGVVRSRIHASPGAKLSIGERTFLNYGVSLRARERLSIGAHCLLGSHVQVRDDVGAPVVVGDFVWLAHGAVILPGVTVGEGSVVSAGSVVTSDVPPGSLAVGNPATCVKLEREHKAHRASVTRAMLETADM